MQSVCAQKEVTEELAHRVYCELVGTEKLSLTKTKVKVEVDFGQVRKNLYNNTIVDENGKVLEFNSMIDAMNFMGERGWKFEQAYVVTVSAVAGAEHNVYHWLLSKDIVGDDIQEGLLTKSQYKVKQKKQEK